MASQRSERGCNAWGRPRWRFPVAEVHLILQKVEGTITFHTAASTAYPQPAPGTAPAPGPLRVVSDQLVSSLGVREVTLIQ